MSLINCPECGEQISEKATECVHCGASLIEEPIIEKNCLECGTMLSDTDTSCPNCGCPIESIESEEEPQKVELTNVRLSINKKKRNIILVVIAVLVVGCVAGFVIKQKRAERISATYHEKLSNAVYTMFEGAAKAESAGNLIHSVWSNAIYEKEDPETDKYTKEEVEDWASCGDSVEHLKELLSHNHFIGAFDKANRMVGFSSMNKDGYLHSMFVHKDWQGKGVATQLLSEVERIAKQLGVVEITSEVSLTARPFFEKKGYEIVKIQKYRANKLELTNFIMRHKFL